MIHGKPNEHVCSDLAIKPVKSSHLPHTTDLSIAIFQHICGSKLHISETERRRWAKMSGFNATMPELKNISINVIELTYFHNKTAFLPNVFFQSLKCAV